MKQTMENLKDFCTSHVDWTRPPFDTDKEALDLCRSMMDPVVSNRPTAVEAQKHSWFSHKPELPESAKPQAPPQAEAKTAEPDLKSPGAEDKPEESKPKNEDGSAEAEAKPPATEQKSEKKKDANPSTESK